MSLKLHPTAPNMQLSRTQPGFRQGTGLNALALAMVLAFAGTTAHALSLGRLNVLSALGEPLLAEIEVPQITEAEASSLRIGTASPDTFRAAGADFNAALTGADVRLLRRPDGRTYLRVTGNRAVNEPYMDLILEANWASGRIVRDYTMLFDPPSLRPSPAPVVPPQTVDRVSAAPTATALTPVPPVPAAQAATLAATSKLVNAPDTSTPPTPLQAQRNAPPPLQKAEKSVKTARATTKAVEPAAVPAAKGAVTVKNGDTAGNLASANKPRGVTLDQMLVAMLRANPQAFIGGNVNRIKAGAILDLPDAQAVEQIDAGEARQTITAQSQDFNAFRQRLAGAVPSAPADTPQRKASGKIQTEVTEQKPAAKAPDQLKLTKGVTAPKADTQAEDKIAMARQAQANAAREAELARTVAELSKMAPAAPAPAPAPSPAPVVEAPAPVPAPAAEPAAPVKPAEDAAPVSAATPAEKPAAPAVEVPALAPPPKPGTETTAPDVPLESDLLTEVMGNPFTLPAAGGILVALLGFGAYRLRQRKKHAGVDSSYLESRLQPDSFFGASGGQSIDTAEAVATGSSMMYSPSQLDAGGDVDPVAEADVYLAYGRDLQAEEILKEALRINPKRVAIHSKMLEIYAKRRDAKAFEVLATEVFALTGGTGPEWDHACLLGQELDPANPLYQPGGRPLPIDGAPTDFASDMPLGMANTQPFIPLPDEAPPPSPLTSGPLDLDLDFSAADAPPIDMDEALPEPAPVEPSSADDALEFTLDGDFEPSMPAPAMEPVAPPAFELDADDLSFDIPADSAPEPQTDTSPDPFGSEQTLSFDLNTTPDAAAELQTTRLTAQDHEATSAPVDDNSLLTFDMGDLSLDMPGTDSVSPLEDIPEGDPLETKLSLAAEFMAIGDMEGARSLAEEVVEQATGRLKDRAKAFLSDLG